MRVEFITLEYVTMLQDTTEKYTILHATHQFNDLNTLTFPIHWYSTKANFSLRTVDLLRHDHQPKPSLHGHRGGREQSAIISWDRVVQIAKAVKHGYTYVSAGLQ